MTNIASKEVVLKIMQKKKWWKPYEVQRELMKKKIFISDGTLTRQFRRWNPIVSNRPPKARGAWEYTAW